MAGGWKPETGDRDKARRDERLKKFESLTKIVDRKTETGHRTNLKNRRFFSHMSHVVQSIKGKAKQEISVSVYFRIGIRPAKTTGHCGHRRDGSGYTGEFVFYTAFLFAAETQTCQK